VPNVGQVQKQLINKLLTNKQLQLVNTDKSFARSTHHKWKTSVPLGILESYLKQALSVQSEVEALRNH